MIPVLQALILAERVYETNDGQKIIAGTFSQILLRKRSRSEFLSETTDGDGESQIIPMYLGEPNLTMQLAGELFDRGLFVPGIRPPSVPAGESLLRISVSAGHSEEHLEQLLTALGQLRHRAGRGG